MVFDFYLEAFCASEAVFLQYYRPTGIIKEITTHCIGWHYLYRFKVKVSVLPNSFSVNYTKASPEFVANIEIFR